VLELAQELIEKYDEEKQKGVGQFAMLGCRQRPTLGSTWLDHGGTRRINYEG